MIQITDYLVKLIEKEGVILEHRDHVRAELDKSILDGCFSFIDCDGKRIGFFSWVVNPDGILLENMLIFGQFRGKFTLLRIRKMLRDRYGIVPSFSWRNRKQHRQKKFIQREAATC